ncbi:MAG: holo-[acyl-carrier-protein] synthase [Gemmatimonadetes bacterium]|nr:MAG: holo-[acyl-carrier-protein] synthase [Gemmatimonadota bacterium]
MIVGIGIDVVDPERLSRVLDSIGERVFTARELAACAGRADRIQALAARFAAKEACLKALGTGVDEGALRHVEIVPGDGGPPQLRVSGALAARARERRVRTAHVSMTHERGVAAAVVILEGTTTGASRRARPSDRTSWTLATVSSGTW